MRALKALVIFMGILILVAMAVVAVTLYKRATGSSAVSELADPASQIMAGHQPALPGRALAAFGEAEISLPQGARLERIDSAKGRLLLLIRLRDASQQIRVLDIADGRELGTIHLTPTP